MERSGNILAGLFLVALLFPANGFAQQEALPTAGATDLKQQEIEQRKPAEEKRVSTACWQNFKKARYGMLLYNTAVNNYYNAVLMDRLGADPKAVDRMIDGSIAARQAMNLIEACPEEYREAASLLKEAYELLRKMELMAENREVAFTNLEKWKADKKRVDELLDKYDELLKLK